MIIDSDTHVIESDATWATLGDAGPRLVVSQKLGEIAGEGFEDSYWLFDQNLIRRQAFDPAKTRTPTEARELWDVEHRLADMDQLGVDVQVIYSTYFLTRPTMDPARDVQICGAYNSWMGSVCQKSESRLRWACVLPLLDIPTAVDELRRSVKNGAVAVHVRGIESDRMLTDPYFFPVYAEAEALNVPICIHAGNGCRYLDDYLYRGAFPFARNKLPVIGAFNALGVSDVPDRFPKLRFGFVEAAASWVPYLLRDLERRLERQRGRQVSVGTSFLRQRNFFVTCQLDDDLEYLVARAGSDNLVVGSDYGHADNSSELEAIPRFRRDGRLSVEDREKIVSDNALSLYALLA